MRHEKKNTNKQRQIMGQFHQMTTYAYNIISKRSLKVGEKKLFKPHSCTLCTHREWTMQKGKHISVKGYEITF